jgi:hypothetical protein
VDFKGIPLGARENVSKCVAAGGQASLSIELLEEPF